MCGIAGYLTSAAHSDLEALSASLQEAMHHRGPDSSRGVIVPAFRSRRLLIAATRLAVRDPSAAGGQPMTGPGGAVVALNGEIYNAGTLRGELEAAGHAFRSGSDTEVVLAAFERWGHSAFPRLRGIFTIAAWDAGRRELCLVRDALGVKPLYVSRGVEGFAFASEIRALLGANLAEREVDSAGLSSFLATGSPVEPTTLVKGVTMLEPGTTLIVGEHGERSDCWWSAREVFSRSPDLDGPEAVEALRETLERSVANQLVSDVPLGLFLSGGIDSSALVALASNAAAEVHTRSIVFDEPKFSEEQWMRRVVDRYGTRHEEVRLTAEDFLVQLPACLKAMDQPTFDGVNTYVVSDVARQSGLTVALAGTGGDELWGGYELFRTVPRMVRLRRGLSRVPMPLPGAVAKLAARRGDRARKMARWLSGEDIDPMELQREILDPVTRAALLPGEQATPKPRHAADDLTDPNMISRRELDGWLRNVLLRDTDVMSMAHSLEVRVPLLDQDIVELAARIPGRAKMAGTQTKAVFVDAVRDLLPAGLAERPKMGFVLPFERWIGEGALGERVREVLLEPSAGGAVGAALDPHAVADVWKAYESGRTSWSRPWALYVAKIWGERHL